MAEDYNNRQERMNRERLAQLAQLGQINAAGAAKRGDIAASGVTNAVNGYFQGQNFAMKAADNDVWLTDAQRKLKNAQAEDDYWNGDWDGSGQSAPGTPQAKPTQSFAPPLAPQSEEENIPAAVPAQPPIPPAAVPPAAIQQSASPGTAMAVDNRQDRRVTSPTSALGLDRKRAGLDPTTGDPIGGMPQPAPVPPPQAAAPMPPPQPIQPPPQAAQVAQMAPGPQMAPRQQMTAAPQPMPASPVDQSDSVAQTGAAEDDDQPPMTRRQHMLQLQMQAGELANARSEEEITQLKKGKRGTERIATWKDTGHTDDQGHPIMFDQITGTYKTGDGITMTDPRAKPDQAQWQATSQVDPQGHPIMFNKVTGAYSVGDVNTAPKAAKPPKNSGLVRIDTVDDDGNPETTFVKPTEGATYTKPVKPGKDGDPGKIYSELVGKIESNRGRPDVSSAQKNLLAIGNAKELISQYPDLDKMPAAQANLLNAELSKISSGGVGSEHGQKAMEANTAVSNWQAFKSRVGNEPTPADLGAFIRENQRYLNGLEGVSKNVVSKYHRSIYNGYKDRLTPDQDTQFKQDYAQDFQDNPDNPPPDAGQLKVPYAPHDAPPSSQAGSKSVTRKQFSPSRNQTKVTYSDGTEVILDGQQ